MLLVDDHALLRTGVANIINQEPDLRVVAEAGDGIQAIEAYERHRPDVTLLDLRMPVMEGVEVVRRIRDRDPQARLIILTTYDTDDEISRALKAGAKAYVLKDISADDLVSCIRDVLAGKTYLAPAAAAKLAEGVTRVRGFGRSGDTWATVEAVRTYSDADVAGLRPGDVVVRAFAAAGWGWGGDWHAPKDYQHFSATGG